MSAVLLLVQAAVIGIVVLGPVVFVAAIAALTITASLILGHTPVVLADASATGGLAGRIGFAFSIGGGVGAFVVGAIKNSMGWPIVFLCLAGAALVAAAAASALSSSHSGQSRRSPISTLVPGES